MRTKVLRDTIAIKEITITILIGVYVIFYYSPILAEYIEARGEGRLIANTISGNDIEPSQQKDWLTIKSAYFTIYCDGAVNLKAVGRKIRKRRLYFAGSPTLKGLGRPEEKIAHRMDILFRRAEEILDMYPRDMNVKVKIFKNQKELNNEYYRIFKQRKSLISFYIYKYDTIYTCETNISDSVMAHEMGHAIIDHYFVILPPEKVKEILARYVDMHLKE